MLVKRYRNLPAIECIQQTAQKVKVTEKDILLTNKNGMGNQVGTITNYATSMMEVQANFKPDSREYKELEYRIKCGQLHQQNELDKIKGIIAKPMPSRWYNRRACGEDKFLTSICAKRKPYFMIYVYDTLKTEYKNYIKESNATCLATFGCEVSELINKTEHTDEEKDFLEWYEYFMPVGNSNCTMNRICHYIEKQMEGYKSKLKQNSNFNYEVMKCGCKINEKHKQALIELQNQYIEEIRMYKIIMSKKHTAHNANEIYDATRKRRTQCTRYANWAKEICPDDDERADITLDIAYNTGGNKQFCWDIAGTIIVKRLEELNVHI